MDRVRTTEALIDRSALAHNLREARRCAPRSRVLAVVKADAYGHGAVECSRAFVEAGADWLGVALVEEGLELRAAGIRAPVLVLGLGGDYTDHRILLQNDLVPMIFRPDQLAGLAAAARAMGRVAQAHVKLDTGMGRIGALPAELPALLEAARALPEVRLTGLASHFANADLRDPAATAHALELFEAGRRAMLAAGMPLELCHLANSAATLGLPAAHYDMIRPGLMLYGAAPAPAFEGVAELRPAMTWVTSVAHLKRVPAGTPISYGHRWRARRESLIASLPVGYADGYRRALTNTAHVLVEGRRAPVAGTVCMDMTMVDVTDVPGVRVGSEVVLLGPGVTATEMAEVGGTISWEVFCAVGKRVPRVYT